MRITIPTSAAIPHSRRIVVEEYATVYWKGDFGVDKGAEGTANIGGVNMETTTLSCGNSVSRQKLQSEAHSTCVCPDYICKQCWVLSLPLLNHSGLISTLTSLTRLTSFGFIFHSGAADHTD